MKRHVCVVIILAFLFASAAVAFADDKKDDQGAVNTSLGQLSVYGTFKAGFNYNVGNQELQVGTPTTSTDKKTGITTVTQPLQAAIRNSDMSFSVDWFELGVKGWVLDKGVTYAISVLGVDNATSYSGGNPVSTIQVLDMKLGFHYIPYVGIYIGRIIPAFCYYNSIPAAAYKTIEQPFINQYMVPSDWQTGLNLGLVTDYVDANLGVYNGRQFNPQVLGVWGFLPQGAANPVGNPATNWGDQNTAKDIHFGVIGKPLAGMGKEHVDDMRIRASLWYGMPLDGFKKDSSNNVVAHNAAVTMINADLDYLGPFGLTVIGEVLYAQYVWDKKLPPNFTTDRLGMWTGKADSTANTLTSLSYNLMAAFNFGPLFRVPIELLVRYDWFDPDTLNNAKQRPTSVNDQLTDLTGGFNYYIKSYSAMIRLDYIHHMQQWKTYSVNTSPTTVYQMNMENVRGNGNQVGIQDDELKLEAQVSF
jgi:hypothetical protein